MQKKIAVAREKMPTWVRFTARRLSPQRLAFPESGLSRSIIGGITLKTGLERSIDRKSTDAITVLATELVQKNLAKIFKHPQAQNIAFAQQIVAQIDALLLPTLNLQSRNKREIVKMFIRITPHLIDALETIEGLVAGSDASINEKLASAKKVLLTGDILATNWRVNDINMRLMEKLLRLDPAVWAEYKRKTRKIIESSLSVPSKTYSGRLTEIDNWIINEITMRRPFAKSICDYACGALQGSPTTIDTRNALDANGLNDVAMDAVDIFNPSKRAELQRKRIGFYKADATRKPLGKKYDIIRIANLEQHLTWPALQKIVWNLGKSLNNRGILLFAKSLYAHRIEVSIFERHEFTKGGKQYFSLKPLAVHSILKAD